MKRIFFYMVCLAIVTLTACNKKDSSKEIDTSLTIENLSGTYGLNALTWKSGSVTVNVYDQLDDCEKDNLIKLNSDKTINYIDAGIVCSPPENGDATWDLKGDSLFISGGVSSKIQSFDGKILILTGTPPNEPTVQATSTFEKK